MIYRVRTITLSRDEKGPAIEVTVRAPAYVTAHFPGIELEILENVAGPLNQIHMVTHCASLAALEAYETKRKTDSGWQALIEEFGQLAPGAESVDHLYRTLT